MYVLIDALHIMKLDDGTFEIGVHIADVSYFLRPNTALDTEASRRATSVYLVQKVIPMLPSILCEDLCSLNPDVDRLAFSCIWRMNEDGTLCAHPPPWFGRTIIRSCAKLDYPTAQRMIDGIIPNILSANDDFLNHLPEEVWEQRRRPVGQSAAGCVSDVVMMAAIAKRRRALRLANGALVLNRSKLSFRLDRDGNPVEVSSYQSRQSNSLVEEYMLLANYLVAQKLLNSLGEGAFLRSHPPPEISNMGRIVAFGELVGTTIDTTSALSLQRGLSALSQRGDVVLLKVMTALLTQPMKAAQYFAVTEGSDPQSWEHYALAISCYTHFTSPIRRYADVMVHRLLDRVLQGEGEGSIRRIDTEELQRLKRTAEQCNTMKEASKMAQDRSDRVFLAVYLSSRTEPTIEDAIVIDIGAKSFTVLLLNYGFDVRLFVNNMPNVEATYEEKKNTLLLMNGAKTAPGKVAVEGTLQFGYIEIVMLKRLKIMLTAKKTAPIDVEAHLVGELSV